FDFQKRSAAPTSKNQPERTRCCLTFASRARGQPDRPSWGLRAVRTRDPLPLRSAFASSVRPSPSIASALTRGLRWSRRAALALKMRPTTTLAATTSKSSSFHSPDGREAEARLRTRVVLVHVPPSFRWDFPHVQLGIIESRQLHRLAEIGHGGSIKQQFGCPLPLATVFASLR